jgi:hypothetical protein
MNQKVIAEPMPSEMASRIHVICRVMRNNCFRRDLQNAESAKSSVSKTHPRETHLKFSEVALFQPTQREDQAAFTIIQHLRREEGFF